MTTRFIAVYDGHRLVPLEPVDLIPGETYKLQVREITEIPEQEIFDINSNETKSQYNEENKEND